MIVSLFHAVVEPFTEKPFFKFDGTTPPFLSGQHLENNVMKTKVDHVTSPSVFILCQGGLADEIMLVCCTALNPSHDKGVFELGSSLKMESLVT